MAALLNWEVMRPHTKREHSGATWHFPLVTPNEMGKLHFGAAKSAVICAIFIDSTILLLFSFWLSER